MITDLVLGFDDPDFDPNGPAADQVCHHYVGEQPVSYNGNLVCRYNSRAWHIADILENRRSTAWFLRRMVEHWYPGGFTQSRCLQLVYVIIRPR